MFCLLKCLKGLIMSSQINQGVSQVIPAFADLTVSNFFFLVELKCFVVDTQADFILSTHVQYKSFVVVELGFCLVEFDGC
jgi:hypothetical protein